jgi:hypothetical protein
VRVFQIPIAGDALLAQLHDIISRADDRPKPDVIGDVVADIAAGPPRVDRNMPRAKKVAALPRKLADDIQSYDVTVRSLLHYPAGGGMGWHTNSEAPGWRVYVPHVAVARPLSGMLTTDGCFMDRSGFANLFEIASDRDSWHAVFAMTERCSIGVRLPTDSERVHAWLGLAPLI